MEKIHGTKLLEIAVATLICGLVIATSVVWFLDLRKGSRDTQRMADIKQIQKDLLNYFSEHREYPETKDLYTVAQGLPLDPGGERYGYENINKETYVLGTCLESPRTADVQSYSRADAENYEMRGAGTKCTCASINAYCVNPDL